MLLSGSNTVKILMILENICGVVSIIRILSLKSNTRKAFKRNSPRPYISSSQEASQTLSQLQAELTETTEIKNGESIKVVPHRYILHV